MLCISQQCNPLNRSEILRRPTHYNSLKNNGTFCTGIPKESDRLGHSSTICVRKYYVQCSEITQFFPVKFMCLYFSIPCGVCGCESAAVTCFSLRTLFSLVSIVPPRLYIYMSFFYHRCYVFFLSTSGVTLAHVILAQKHKHFPKQH
jgi:hypothetical protein